MFSVVIPVYNHRPYILDGLVSALRARLVAEVLVADDGSRDGSAALLERIAAPHGARVRNLTPPGGGNAGAHARLNQLIEAAGQPWIAVLNSDDAFLPDRFAAAAQRVRKTAVDFVAGHILIMDEEGRPLGRKRGPLDPEYPFPAGLDVAGLLAAGDLLPLLANQNFLATTSNMMFTRALWQRIGGFADYRYVHDWDFALRAAVLGTPAYLPLYLTSYRVHRSNTISESTERVDRETTDVFRRFAADFPDRAARPEVAAALAGNRHILHDAPEAAA
ncbi:glycosyltransferase family 2 protein [Azospirillum halopraeferens]|uniref:glycosyltransferase family 2 protein n=1 Tax=Azospirillum halopraeferens TaxID=34010 RepID=UPI000418658C|nr:glycosyltransferase [Azospirillum halopraeferens]